MNFAIGVTDIYARTADTGCATKIYAQVPLPDRIFAAGIETVNPAGVVYFLSIGLASVEKASPTALRCWLVRVQPKSGRFTGVERLPTSRPRMARIVSSQTARRWCCHVARHLYALLWPHRRPTPRWGPRSVPATAHLRGITFHRLRDDLAGGLICAKPSPPSSVRLPVGRPPTAKPA